MDQQWTVTSLRCVWTQEQVSSTSATHLVVNACALQVVVDAIDSRVIVSALASKTFDFGTVKEEELHNIKIPVELQAGLCMRTSFIVD